MLYIGVTRRPVTRFWDMRHADRYEGMVVLQLTEDPTVAIALETELIGFIRNFLPGCVATNVGAGGEHIPRQVRDACDAYFFIYACFGRVRRL